MNKRIAVVPAYNEAPTVESVLSTLYPLVDELIVVNDGSTDETGEIVRRWAASHPNAVALEHARNRGMSAAYYTAFTQLRRRLRDGTLDANDLIYTIDADGQHELEALDELCQILCDEQLDAIIARRDLSNYPRYKRLGNAILSRWATIWAGQALYDVESGYRIFRLGALSDALSHYRGYRSAIGCRMNTSFAFPSTDLVPECATSSSTLQHVRSRRRG
jgi:glycosyltransferase involved in cell wall biosynthesis